jgi:hypothetical protein
MCTRIFKHRLKEILFNNTQNNYKIIPRSKNYELKLNNSLINTQIKIKKDYNILPFKQINQFYLNSKDLDSLKRRNNINKGFNKVLDMMNNSSKINSIYYETINNINNNKKRNNTFQSIQIKNDILLNKPPVILRNDIFKLDKNFLREISPINNYILKKKKLNKYKNSFMTIKKSKNNSYFNLNKTKNSKIKLKKFDCDIFNNKSEFITNETIKINNYKKMSFERANSFFKFNTLKF